MLITPLIAAVAYGGPDAVRLLLDQKANVNAQDVRGMTPLMLALGAGSPRPACCAYAAGTRRGSEDQVEGGETALDWARKFNHPEVLKALNTEPTVIRAAFNSTAINQSTPTSMPRPQEAVQKSVDLLQRTSTTFFIQGGCPSCHAQNLSSIALSAAKAAGIRTDPGAASDRAQQTRSFWSPQEQTLMLRMDAPGGHNMTSYGVLQFAAEGVAANATTDAMVHNIAAQQQAAGNWHSDTLARPPMADGDFSNTAIAIRSLSVYMIPARRTELEARIAGAAAWLRSNKPVTAEDCNMQLLGLKWAGAGKASLAEFAQRIVAAQRADGGWAQTSFLASDAYATGQTMFALKEAGLPLTDPAFRRGAEFLLRTQLAEALACGEPFT